MTEKKIRKSRLYQKRWKKVTLLPATFDKLLTYRCDTQVSFGLLVFLPNLLQNISISTCGLEGLSKRCQQVEACKMKKTCGKALALKNMKYQTCGHYNHIYFIFAPI